MFLVAHKSRPVARAVSSIDEAARLVGANLTDLHSVVTRTGRWNTSVPGPESNNWKPYPGNEWVVIPLYPTK